MHTLTIDEIMRANAGLKRICDMPMAASVSFRLARIRKFLVSEEEFFQEFQNRMIREHGEPIPEKPGQFKIDMTMPGHPTFMRSMQAVVGEPVPYPFSKLKLSELPELTPSEIADLMPILEGLPEGEVEADEVMLGARELYRKKHLA